MVKKLVVLISKDDKLPCLPRKHREKRKKSKSKREAVIEPEGGALESDKNPQEASDARACRWV